MLIKTFKFTALLLPLFISMNLVAMKRKNHEESSPLKKIVKYEYADYYLGDKIDEGYSSKVYHIVKNHSYFSTDKVAKVIPLEKFNCLEIDILQQLEHPSVVKLDGFFEENKKMHLIMEFGGRSLKKIIEDGNKLSENDVKKIMIQVLDGIDYIHQKGIIHRDLSASNIFVSSKGIVKIGDFGAATIKGSSTKSAINVDVKFASPEYLNNELVTKSTDLWSFGIILHYVLYGSYPSRNGDEIILTKSDSEADNIIKNLLKPSSERSSIADIKNSSFFNKLYSDENQRENSKLQLTAMRDYNDMVKNPYLCHEHFQKSLNKDAKQLINSVKIASLTLEKNKKYGGQSGRLYYDFYVKEVIYPNLIMFLKELKSEKPSQVIESFKDLIVIIGRQRNHIAKATKSYQSDMFGSCPRKQYEFMEDPVWAMNKWNEYLFQKYVKKPKNEEWILKKEYRFGSKFRSKIIRLENNNQKVIIFSSKKDPFIGSIVCHYYDEIRGRYESFDWFKDKTHLVSTKEKNETVYRNQLDCITMQHCKNANNNDYKFIGQLFIDALNGFTLKKLAKFSFYFNHATMYERGQASVFEWLLQGILICNNNPVKIDLNQWKENHDGVALDQIILSCLDFEEFNKIFLAYLSETNN